MSPISAPRVFISYNSADRAAVGEIRRLLEARGIRSWFDQDITPGEDWFDSLTVGLRECQVIAAFVGPNGQGQFQKKEIGRAFAEAVTEGKRLIPVALPGVDPDTADFPSPVKGNRFVAFRSLDDQGALGDLIWGITGKRPERRLEPEVSGPAHAANPIDDAVLDFQSELRFGNLTFFVGGGSCEPGERPVSENTRVASALLQSLGYTGPEIVAPIDFVSTCFAIRRGDVVLENAVADLAAGASTDDSLATLLARWLVKLRQTLPAVRQRHRTQQLVVTTNIDLALECALAAAGLSFTRVVQKRHDPDPSGQRLPSVVIDRFQGGAGALDAGGVELAATAVRNEDLGDVILYKARGSQDVPGSCTLSTSQYFEFARNAATGQFIPNDIERLMGDSHALFVGFCPLDPDLRLLHHAILQRQFAAHARRPRYALMPHAHQHEAGFQRLEDLVGTRLRSSAERELQVKIIDAAPAPFLDSLLLVLERDLP